MNTTTTTKAAGSPRVTWRGRLILAARAAAMTTMAVALFGITAPTVDTDTAAVVLLAASVALWGVDIADRR